MLWSHADDTAYMGPMGGFDQGWDAISSLWDKQAKLKLGGKVVAENIHIVVGPSLAIAHYMEQGANIVDGKKASSLAAGQQQRFGKKMEIGR